MRTIGIDPGVEPALAVFDGLDLVDLFSLQPSWPGAGARWSALTRALEGARVEDTALVCEQQYLRPATDNQAGGGALFRAVAKVAEDAKAWEVLAEAQGVQVLPRVDAVAWQSWFRLRGRRAERKLAALALVEEHFGSALRRASGNRSNLADATLIALRWHLPRAVCSVATVDPCDADHGLLTWACRIGRKPGGRKRRAR